MKLGVLMLVLGFAQPEAPAPAVPPALRGALEALDPRRPREYFELGEVVLDELATPEDAELARRLFVLAFEIDRASGWRDRLGPSVCVALADPRLETSDERRRWLLAIAGGLDARYAAPDWNVSAAEFVPDEVALGAACAMGLVRAGEGVAARRLLEKPEVNAFMLRHERLIASTGRPGALARLAAQAERWPCPECKNARVVPRMVGGTLEYRLCNTCRGNPGPELSSIELIGHLRFEAAILGGVQTSWAAQAVSDLGQPLRDPDPADLARGLGVDASASVHRDGQWTKP